MKCEVIHDLLPSYLDETCSEETRTIVDDHLNNCEDCRKLVNDLNNVEMEVDKSIISEDKVFKKVIRNHKKTLLIMFVIFILIFFLFGTRMNSEIMKVALQSYAKNHYPEYDLVMTDFGYEDPSSQGFGVDNGFYYAEFVTQDHKISDIQFNVFTEGYFFNIKDNYHAKIEMKDNTRMRLINEYKNEIMKSLYRNSDLDIIEGDVHWSCTEEYYEKNVADKLELNMPYTRSIDQIIPMTLTLTLNVNENEVQNYKSMIKEIVKVANENDFHPFELLLLLQTEENNYRIDHIHCEEDIDNQELVIE